MRKIVYCSILLLVCLVCVSCSQERQRPYADAVSEDTENTTVYPFIMTTSTIEETTTRETSTEKPTEKPTIPPATSSAAPIVTTIPSTTTAPPLPTQPTKPKLTVEIEDALIDQFVQLHAPDILAIEEKHDENIEAIHKESEEYELNALIQLRQLKEMGYENTGLYQSTLSQIENRRQQFSQEFEQENTRYENEKAALLAQIQAEIDQYIDQNFEA